MLLSPCPPRGLRTEALFAILCIYLTLVATGCGNRTLPVDDLVIARPQAGQFAEQCNGLDEDLDGQVDENFRDQQGRYVHSLHCGRCYQACTVSENATGADCSLVAEQPSCVATGCFDGFVRNHIGQCVSAYDHFCLGCQQDLDCGDFSEARCESIGQELRCTVDCSIGCPEGYACHGQNNTCVPQGGSCSCGSGDNFVLACELRDPEDNRCVGEALCNDGSLSECVIPQEACDQVDNDCDGHIDEGFRNELGSYFRDQHCGGCGIRCDNQITAQGDLICGGDPFNPSCVLLCPDFEDQQRNLGDRIDADFDILTGCECTVSNLQDEPGPVGEQAADLDTDCDGADGIITQGIYVAADGSDEAPGSPTAPLATISEAITVASESMPTASPRTHIFVASGNYPESITLIEGINIHGGYRRDFRALDPAAYRTEVRAPTVSNAPAGAALIAIHIGLQQTTVVEGLVLRGVDATQPGQAAVGAYLRNPGPKLYLHQLEVHAGNGGNGADGAHGTAGAQPTVLAGNGQPPRAAIENEFTQCENSPANTVVNGRAGQNVCDDKTVHGGAGGSPVCPIFGSSQPAGAKGQNANANTLGGQGGAGGTDSEAPIFNGPSCDQSVCCGLADIRVPFNFDKPQDGSSGSDGRPGILGMGCQDDAGTFATGQWAASRASAGSDGSAGAGGGGGGAGGGMVFLWVNNACEYADGLGGAGGGGGAGGCGGSGGDAGRSGGPSVALLMVGQNTVAPPQLTQLQLISASGGHGGIGGAGGDGGAGGSGGFGGQLSLEEQTTPTTAGPFAGGRGGKGGNGGPGGGGGGGCGGKSVGIWIAGTWQQAPNATQLAIEHAYDLGNAGQGGVGGGGSIAGEDGLNATAQDVYVE